MKYIIYSVIIIVFFGLMSGLFANFPFFGTVPNLILLFIIFLALEEDTIDSYVAAVIGGVMLDAVSGLAPGSFLIGLIILVFLVQLAFKEIIYYKFEQKYLPILVCVAEGFIFSWLWIFNALGAYLHWSQSSLGALYLWQKFLPNVLYTLLLMYPIFWFTEWLKLQISKRQNYK